MDAYHFVTFLHNSQNILSVIQHSGDCFVNLRPESRLLRLEVDEGNATHPCFSSRPSSVTR